MRTQSAQVLEALGEGTKNPSLGGAKTKVGAAAKRVIAELQKLNNLLSDLQRRATGPDTEDEEGVHEFARWAEDPVVTAWNEMERLIKGQ